MAFTIGLLFSALAVSAVAAYFSIVGLVTIFPTAAIPIIVMGSVLEVAKLITAAWLYRNWAKANVLLKTYFTTAVVVLSIITSLGIFGFLSRAHIDQTAANFDYEVQVEVVEFRLEAEQQKITNAQNRIKGLDDTLATSLGKDKNYVNRTQAEERAELAIIIDNSIKRIDELNQELLPMRRDIAKQEAELGPINYIAELFFGTKDTKSVDKAVRIVIMLLIFVFDPLAILLVVAANMSFLERRGESITFLDEKAVYKEFIKDTEASPEKEIDPQDWVANKYGKDSAMDPEKEKMLKWLIDKKMRGMKE